MDYNNLYVSYCENILEKKGFFEIPKDERKMIIIDGSNLLHGMNAQIENNKFKVDINQVTNSINNYFTKKLPKSKFLIDIVMKHLYSFLPETINNNKLNNVIYSYERRPIPNNINEGNITENQLLTEKGNDSYDDAVIFAKLYAYSHFMPMNNIIVVSCDGYKDYRNIFRLHPKGYDVHVVETSYYFTDHDDDIHSQSYLHFISYENNASLVEEMGPIVRSFYRLSNLDLRRFMYNDLGIANFHYRHTCAPNANVSLPLKF